MLEGIEFLGAKPSAIKKGEDRQAFKEAMLKIGMDLPKSRYAYTEEEALEAAKEIGFPLIIRASFTLAGGGSGVAYNIDEFKAVAKNGLETSPINEILIEESLLGWKEYEMEVIRDKFDNCIIVCSIENLDPMGVHTGDSITIAPALTLTDKEYQRMRDASFKILREIGVDTGGSNVQFAINPKNGRMTVIEMNPRVSRSSALASKATGYPIAKVATMLAVGFSLDEIKNDITGTPASFEPSIDYIVTKIPRFTFEKFPQADSTLTTSMKSIGEVMAIGGSFKESLQKALCSLETGIFGLNQICNDLETIKKEIRRPNANRLLYIAEGFGLGMSIEEMHELCKIDKWFLHEIKEIVDSESSITSQILSDESLMRRIKSYGFSDKMIAHWLKHNDGMEISESEVYQARIGLGVECVYNEVDTCAAEFPSLTPYLYSTIGNFQVLGGHSVLSDKSAILRSPTAALTSSKLLVGSLENADFSSQSLECQDSSFSLESVGNTTNTRIADSVSLECQNSQTDSTPCHFERSEKSTHLEFKDSTKQDSSTRDSKAEVSLSDFSGFQTKGEWSYLKGNDRALSVESVKSTKETTPKKVMIIGGGPNRIGQGIEFDYCCVHSSFALNDLGIKSIMYNCNPETVSTDYDTSDVLYFEPIDFERVRAVIEREKPDGIIVHFGGQTPLKLANSLTKINAKIIGTSAKVIDTAEDREKFASFVNNLGLKQPQNGIAYEKEQAYSVANKIGFPVLVRPSYVLGGRAMRIVYDDDELKQYMDEVIAVSDSSPVLIDKFLEYAIELDVDCISDGESVYIGGIMEHIEEAGIHSGDSASSLPTINIRESMLKEIEQSTAKIALKLGVVGLMNVQYAIYNNELYLIEVNPRASRTVPFVSKATGLPLAKIATRVMWNHSVKKAESKDSILEEALRFYDKYKKVDFTQSPLKPKTLQYVCLKESVFPFTKLSGAELSLGPEMKSTGEVMGIGRSFGLSFAKSQLACKNALPLSGEVFLSLASLDKKEGVALANDFIELGFSICATEGTYKILCENGIEASHILKVSEGRPNIIDRMMNNQIALAINTSDNLSNKDDTHLIRTQIIKSSIPYFTTLAAARVAIEAIRDIKKYNLSQAFSLQEYLES
ncbi:carbamoyl-phosphate synthase, large subunit [Helicobacter cinaedi CCUG 18818 = ATCC BAA-847]|nr:carbamoyl-phosphate synthase, large subunit [Helicobacter cinaedi CCUG 18818 = ATCC BAA-847]